MTKTTLNPKPPRDDAARRAHQYAVKRAFVELPAFGLTLLTAEVMSTNAENVAYENYSLPQNLEALAFTLKGALRLEMMNSQHERFQRFRRLFGSNTKAKDVSAWRSRIYVEAFDNGASAVRAISTMVTPETLPAEVDDLRAQLAAVTNPVVVMQINDVYLDETRTELLSDLLADFLAQESRLLRTSGKVTVLPPWTTAGKEKP